MSFKTLEHLSGYQARDYHVVDYQMYELDRTGLKFRGPKFEFLPGKYFTCLGAAQTFGCFCTKPYPNLLSERFGIPALNLGYGGAGPEFFCKHQSLLDYINGGLFAIIQVMSGRSQSNSLFESGGLEYLVRRSDGAAVGANEAYRELIEGSAFLRALPPKRLSRFVARSVALPRAKRVIAETRSAWIESYRHLLKLITVPKILFWFSRRSPAYIENYRSVNGLFGEFPQLVNQEMIQAIKSGCNYYVECIGGRGSPQPLISRFTGKPVTVNPALDRPDLDVGQNWTHNRYYPSPEMQNDAADVLSSFAQKIISNTCTPLT